MKNSLLKVLCVVPNSALRDHRVMRSARALQKSGFDVEILGFKEKGHESSIFRDPKSGIMMFREDPAKIMQETKKKHLIYIYFYIFIALSIYCLIYGESALIISICVTFFIIVAAFLIKLKRFSKKKKIMEINNKLNTRYRFFSFNKCVKEFVKEKKYDIIYCNEAHILPSCAEVAKRMGATLVYDAHEFYDSVEGVNSEIVSNIFKHHHSKYLDKVDVFITVSNSIKFMYEKEYEFLHNKNVFILPNIRSDDEFVGGASYDGRLHKRCKIDNDRKIILYQGGISTHRRVDKIIESAIFIDDDWAVIAMGKVPAKEESLFEDLIKTIHREKFLRLYREKIVRDRFFEYKDLIDKGSENSAVYRLYYKYKHFYDDPSNAFIIGSAPYEDLINWTMGATVGIIPYPMTCLNHWGAFPNKVYEYAVAGVPMLVTPGGELYDLVQTYNCGWVIPPDFTPMDLAHIINGLTHDEIEVKKAGLRMLVKDLSFGRYFDPIVHKLKGLDSIKNREC